MTILLLKRITLLLLVIFLVLDLFVPVSFFGTVHELNIATAKSRVTNYYLYIPVSEIKDTYFSEILEGEIIGEDSPQTWIRTFSRGRIDIMRNFMCTLSRDYSFWAIHSLQLTAAIHPISKEEQKKAVINTLRIWQEDILKDKESGNGFYRGCEAMEKFIEEAIKKSENKNGTGE